ncbi:MAG TPA: ethanolamine utilization protein EutN [Elusimicrobia bacterium]|nr:ethanolamine utilization protein EutN [Elusimicrobiota bacterium]
MKFARVVGRVFCTRQYESLDGKRLLLIQPRDWETGEDKGDPLVACEVVGAGASEDVVWVAAREAAVAFPDVPPIDAAVVGIVEGRVAKDFRKKR